MDSITSYLFNEGIDLGTTRNQKTNPTMKNIFLLFFFIQAILAVGQSQYNTQKDIHYYPDSVNKSDQYIDSQCTLDLYYPKSGNGFATIVWFHGGGSQKEKSTYQLLFSTKVMQ